MNIELRPCTPDELILLQSMARKTYDDTFRHLNTPENMQAYLNEAFAMETLLSQLQNPDSHFFFLYTDGTLSGYLKLNEGSAQTDDLGPHALELERIYVLRDFQGKGLGARMMDFAVTEAKRAGKKILWLGVWEKNTSAIAFYKKQGFVPSGTHSFWMGDEEQTDIIMIKTLT